MGLRDVLTPALAPFRSRLMKAPPSLRRVYQSDLHEIYLAFYPGWYAVLVHFQRESLRIMLHPHEDGGHGDAPERQRMAIEALERGGISAHRLLLEAKLQSGNPLTLHDRAALKIAGVAVPREAGRFKDLFDTTS